MQLPFIDCTFHKLMVGRRNKLGLGLMYTCSQACLCLEYIKYSVNVKLIVLVNLTLFNLGKNEKETVQIRDSGVESYILEGKYNKNR